MHRRLSRLPRMLRKHPQPNFSVGALYLDPPEIFQFPCIPERRYAALLLWTPDRGIHREFQPIQFHGFSGGMGWGEEGRERRSRCGRRLRDFHGQIAVCPDLQHADAASTQWSDGCRRQQRIRRKCDGRQSWAVSHREEMMITSASSPGPEQKHSDRSGQLLRSATNSFRSCPPYSEFPHRCLHCHRCPQLRWL